MNVGIGELRNHFSQYLDRVRAGEQLVVTDRGRAVAKLVPATAEPLIDELIAEGVVTRAPNPHRSRPKQRIRSSGTVSDLVQEQRR